MHSADGVLRAVYWRWFLVERKETIPIIFAKQIFAAFNANVAGPSLISGQCELVRLFQEREKNVEEADEERERERNTPKSFR